MPLRAQRCSMPGIGYTPPVTESPPDKLPPRPTEPPNATRVMGNRAFHEFCLGQFGQVSAMLTISRDHCRPETRPAIISFGQAYRTYSDPSCALEPCKAFWSVEFFITVHFSHLLCLSASCPYAMHLLCQLLKVNKIKHLRLCKKVNNAQFSYFNLQKCKKSTQIIEIIEV